MPGNSQIDSIALSHKNSRGIQITLDEVTSADSVPTIRMQSISGDTGSRTTSFNLSWTSAQTSSNREVLYQLEYSWSPEIWLPIGTPTNLTSVSMDMSTLPGGNDSKFRVRAMHGLSTYYSESTPFSVLNQAPELTLETSGALSLAPFKGRLNEVTQGDSFSITPSITDADWTSLNRDGFSAVLKQDGEIVWDSANEPKNRIGVQGSSFSAPKISLDMGVAVPEVCSLAAPFVPGGAVLSLVGGTMCSFNFPNSQLLPGEMTPGDYEFEMTYVDVGGASVTETVSFSIIVPDFLVGPDSTSSAEDVLQEYRSNLQSRAPIDLQDDLSRDELQYYVELERAARGDEDALSDTEISDLQYLYHISDSRANELQEEVAAGTKDGDGQ